MALATINDNGRLAMPGPLSDEDLAIVSRMPGCRSVAGGWTADPSPAAAAKLQYVYKLSPQLLEMSRNWRETVAGRENLRHAVDTSEGFALAQPEERVFDMWDHQLGAYHFDQLGAAGLFDVAMGGGKTKIFIDACVNTQARSILILCPKSVRAVWRREFETHAPGRYEVLIPDKGTTARRAKDLAADIARCDRSGTPFAAVVHFDSAWRSPLAEVLLSVRWDSGALDESHRAKSPTSRVGKFCWKLGEVIERKACLSGTPCPLDPLDLFGQFRFLDPGVLGTSVTAARAAHAVTLGERSGGKVTGPMADKITGMRDPEGFAQLCSPLIWRVTEEQLGFSLPETISYDVPVDLSPKARKAYEKFERDAVVQIDEGLITADNAAVQLIRLRQIAGGWAKGADTPGELICTARRDALLEIAGDFPADDWLVVKCEFTHEVHQAKWVAEKLKRRYAEVSGHANDLTDHGTLPSGGGIVAVQTRAGGTGVDLTKSCTNVIFSSGFSLGDEQQFAKRTHRPGQKRPVRYIHLIAPGTVDETVRAALSQKADVIDSVLRHLKSRSKR